MAREPSPVFLERGSYRRRRVMDAARLVVVVGAGLWMVPLLWPSPEQTDVPPVPMSTALFYIFGVWLALIVVSSILVSRLRRDKAFDEQGEAKE